MLLIELKKEKIMRYKYEFEALDKFEPGRCAYCPLSWADGINYGDLFCVLNCRPDDCPLEKLDQSIDKKHEPFVQSTKAH